MISIYKPNRKNEGCACSFSLGRDGDVFINAVQQFSRDAAQNTGSFKENAQNKDKSIAVKLGQFELGGIIHAITNWQAWKAFHKYEDNSTSIAITPWEKNDADKNNGVATKAYGLKITRNSADVYKLPIELGEAELIKQFLIFCLNEKFFADEKKKNTVPQQ